MTSATQSQQIFPDLMNLSWRHKPKFGSMKIMIDPFRKQAQKILTPLRDSIFAFTDWKSFVSDVNLTND